MKRTLTTLTISVLVIATAAMVGLGLASPKTEAHTSLCHANKPAIAVAATTVVHGQTLLVTGGEPQVPGHSVKATVQYHLSSSKIWKNGASKNLSGAAYSISWKAPAKKGKYKIRVRVTYSGVFNTSATKSVTVN